MTVDLYNSQYLSNLKTEIINKCAINEDNETSKYKQCAIYTLQYGKYIYQYINDI